MQLSKYDDVFYIYIYMIRSCFFISRKVFDALVDSNDAKWSSNLHTVSIKYISTIRNER